MPAITNGLRVCRCIRFRGRWLVEEFQVTRYTVLDSIDRQGTKQKSSRKDDGKTKKSRKRM